MGESKSVAVSFLGKIKTVSQMVAIPLLLYDDMLGRFDPHLVGTWLIIRGRGADPYFDGLLPQNGVAANQ